MKTEDGDQVNILIQPGSFGMCCLGVRFSRQHDKFCDRLLPSLSSGLKGKAYFLI